MSAANLIAHISRLDGVSPYQVRCYSFGNFSAREMFAFVLAARFPKIFVFSRIGRATLCGADEPLSPGQLIEHALIWPIVRPHNQAYPVSVIPIEEDKTFADYIVGRVCHVAIET